MLSSPHLDDSSICSPQRSNRVLLHRHDSNGSEKDVSKAAVEPVFPWMCPCDLQPVALFMFPTAE